MTQLGIISGRYRKTKDFIAKPITEYGEEVNEVSIVLEGSCSDSRFHINKMVECTNISYPRGRRYGFTPYYWEVQCEHNAKCGVPEDEQEQLIPRDPTTLPPKKRARPKTDITTDKPLSKKPEIVDPSLIEEIASKFETALSGLDVSGLSALVLYEQSPELHHLIAIAKSETEIDHTIRYLKGVYGGDCVELKSYEGENLVGKAYINTGGDFRSEAKFRPQQEGILFVPLDGFVIEKKIPTKVLEVCVKNTPVKIFEKPSSSQ